MSGAPGDPRAQDPHRLRTLLRDTHAVLVDFDGPVCDLFGGASTAHIAAEVKARAARVWPRTELDDDVRDCDDSHGVLLLLAAMADRHAPALAGPLDWADEIVERHEYTAVRSAAETADAGRLVRALYALEKPLAIVSNNAEGPVREHLERVDLLRCFTAVCGRDPHDPRLMKPHPDSILRALRLLGDPKPAQTLLIGDQLTDLTAAEKAGVRFLGFTPYEDRAREMLRRGADFVVASHAPVIGVVEQFAGD
ncbi:HAD family phosphatase [Streptomyces sp. NBC_01390]|uniref:HAD family hydrolase n=1 Tax=Streptomyces sp. NBC_01390 TaxID=2903850 RepID=UPI0032507460